MVIKFKEQVRFKKDEIREDTKKVMFTREWSELRVE